MGNLTSTARARAAVLPPGPVKRLRNQLVGRKVYCEHRGSQTVILVRYRGFLMPVAMAADALDIDVHTIRRWAGDDPDITTYVANLEIAKKRALTIKRSAQAVGVTIDTVRKRLRDGKLQDPLTRPKRAYRDEKFMERARVLALDSPFGPKIIAERLRRGWPEERAKSAPYRKIGPASKRTAVRALAEALSVDRHPSLSTKLIMRRLHGGWSPEEARLIPKGQR